MRSRAVHEQSLSPSNHPLGHPSPRELAVRSAPIRGAARSAAPPSPRARGWGWQTGLQRYRADSHFNVEKQTTCEDSDVADVYFEIEIQILDIFASSLS